MSCNLTDYFLEVEFPSYYLESTEAGIIVRYLTDDEVMILELMEQIEMGFNDIKRKYCIK